MSVKPGAKRALAISVALSLLVTACSSGGGSTDQAGVIELAQGEAAPAGYWYAVVLSGFMPGSPVTVFCHDSVDREFSTHTFTMNDSGGASEPTLCYSSDGPDFWVTGGGVTSNRVS